MQKIINVILSGGVGSRLWPLSRKLCPKQYLPIIQGQSLFRLCAERNMSFCDQLIVVGNSQNYLLSRSELKSLGKETYTEIVEALARNTAAAIAFAAFAANENDILFVTPSDHVIVAVDEYKAAISEAIVLANLGFLVTFGIKPTKAETGFGYIEHEGNSVISFKEKPNKDLAVEYISTGRFLWNSGMFCFKAGAYLAELQKFEPIIWEESRKAWENRDGIFLKYEQSIRIPSKSIDYAVMERSTNVRVIPASIGWSDLGSFDALWEHYESVKDDTVFVDKNMALLPVGKRVDFIGVKDLIVVDTKDALLIMPRGQTQYVKQVYERIENEQSELL